MNSLGLPSDMVIYLIQILYIIIGMPKYLRSHFIPCALSGTMLPMTSASPSDSHAIIPPSFAIMAAASVIAGVDFGLRSILFAWFGL